MPGCEAQSMIADGEDLVYWIRPFVPPELASTLGRGG